MEKLGRRDVVLQFIYRLEKKTAIKENSEVGGEISIWRGAVNPATGIPELYEPGAWKNYMIHGHR